MLKCICCTFDLQCTRNENIVNYQSRVISDNKIADLSNRELIQTISMCRLWCIVGCVCVYVRLNKMVVGQQTALIIMMFWIYDSGFHFKFSLCCFFFFFIIDFSLRNVLTYKGKERCLRVCGLFCIPKPLIYIFYAGCLF